LVQVCFPFPLFAFRIYLISGFSVSGFPKNPLAVRFQRVHSSPAANLDGKLENRLGRDKNGNQIEPQRRA